MKKFKLLICSLLLIISFRVLSVSVFATDVTYLEAKDYITLASNKDNSLEIENFLAKCKAENKDAFFNSGTYILKNNIKLVSDVSIIGDEMTIFLGQNKNSDYQINIFDSEDTKNITIKNIIFDNVTIYSQNANSTGWSIEENIFLNAKRVDISIDSGLKPDSSNKNGGELTGYYILKSKTNGNISSNLFLRDSTSKGRGIGLYNTYDFTVTDNYFGLIEDIDDSIVSEKVKLLKDKVLLLDDYNSNSNQGYFMTCVNVISGDSNVLIQGNHFSLNKDIEEAYYENGSGETAGYNRDHIVYAKEYSNLMVVGNYFKGSNKNQDGGLKIRNGSGALVYRNVFEDSLLLLYIQDYSKYDNLIDTYAAENVFINQDYTNERLSLQPGNLAKYPTQSFLIYVQNYLVNGIISNLTIENNKVISADLANETIRVVRKSGDALPQNINIINNTNYLNKALEINNDYKINSSETKFVWSNLDDFTSVDITNLYKIAEANYQISNRKVVSAGSIYLNKSYYNGQELSLDTDYEIFTSLEDSCDILVEGKSMNIPTYSYGLSQIIIKSNYDVETKIYDTIDINDYIDLSMFSNFEVITSDFGVIEENKNVTLVPKSIGKKTVILNCGGFTINFNVLVTDGIISDFTVNDLTLNLGTEAKIIVDYPNDYRVDFSYTYASDCLTIDNENNLRALKPGVHSVLITEKYSNINKIFTVVVNARNVVNLEKDVQKGTSFALPRTINLSSNLNLIYDNNMLTYSNGQITALEIGLANLTIIDLDNELIINYRINITVNTLFSINSSDLEIKLGQRSTIELDIPDAVDADIEFIYNDSALSINEETYEVVGLSVGLHGVTIRDKVTGLIKNITINVTNN